MCYALYSFFLEQSGRCLQALRRTALAMEQLLHVVRQEVPDTASTLRLSGVELADCIEEVSMLRWVSKSRLGISRALWVEVCKWAHVVLQPNRGRGMQTGSVSPWRVNWANEPLYTPRLHMFFHLLVNNATSTMQQLILVSW